MTETAMQHQRQRPNQKDIVHVFNKPKAQERILPSVPRGDSIDRIINVIARAARMTEHLDECTEGSLVDAAVTILGWGLEIGETAYMVPFFDREAKVYRATPIMGYLGMIQIIIASGVVRAVEPSIVYPGDLLDITYGTDSHGHHTPVWSEGREKQKPLGVMLTFKLRNNMSTFRYMTYDEVDAIRQQYAAPKWKKGLVPLWYMIKTAMRQSRKMLATTPTLVRAFSTFAQEQEIEATAENQSLPPSDAEMGSPIDPPTDQRALGEGQAHVADHGTPVQQGVEVPAQAAVPASTPAADTFQDDRDLDDDAEFGAGR